MAELLQAVGAGVRRVQAVRLPVVRRDQLQSVGLRSLELRYVLIYSPGRASLDLTGAATLDFSTARVLPAMAFDRTHDMSVLTMLVYWTMNAWKWRNIWLLPN